MKPRIESAREECHVPISVPFRLFWLHFPPEVFPLGSSVIHVEDRLIDRCVRGTTASAADRA